MRDGRTRLAHKAEHTVDLETGTLVAVTLQGADMGDTTSLVETAIAAAEQVEAAQATVAAPMCGPDPTCLRAGRSTAVAPSFLNAIRGRLGCPTLASSGQRAPRSVTQFQRA